MKYFLTIAASFVACLSVSWQRWGNPLVDCGREMNQPLRLASGEMLYSDIRHIYGPLSPYLNSLLFRVFGDSLNVLYADGIVTAAIILALIYWLSRRLMGPLESTAATLSVMVLCAFKQAGNYILPYSYSAVHGCAFGLAALALVIKYSETERGNKSGRVSTNRAQWLLVLAGLISAMSILAKTEMGAAATATGIAAILLNKGTRVSATLKHLLIFMVSMLVPLSAVYGGIWYRVGFETLSHDSYLFLQNLPPELVYFNRRMAGLDQPGLSLIQMSVAAVRITAVAVFLLSLGSLLARVRFTNPRLAAGSTPASSEAGQTSSYHVWLLLGLSILIFVAIPLLGRVQWESGPYLAMPIILLVLLATAIGVLRREKLDPARRAHCVAMFLIGTYALISLARIILRVRSGGAYSSYLLPASVIVFTYCLLIGVPAVVKDQKARSFTRVIVLCVVFTWIAGTGIAFGFRYRTSNTYPVSSERGTIYAVPDLGYAFDRAIRYIQSETEPGEPVAVMPEGTSLNFFANRPNPLRDDILIPGILDDAAEENAIERIKNSDTKLILITNRATPEFGPAVFGQDYCGKLMSWIEENYDQATILTSAPLDDPRIGSKQFFIQIYRKKSPPNPSE